MDNPHVTTILYKLKSFYLVSTSLFTKTVLFQLDKKQEDLFPTGTKNQEPSVAKMSDDMFLLGKDTQSVLTNLKGEAVSKLAVKWSEIPIQLGMTL